MQRIARCYLAFDRRKGTDPTPSSSLVTSQPTNQPTNPSVSFSIPISWFEKVRYTSFENLLRLPSGATLVGSMVHWPRSRSYFFPSSLLFLLLLFLFCEAPFDSRKYHVSAAKKKKKKKVGGIHIQIVTSRMYPLHGSSVKNPGERRTFERINGRGGWLITKSSVFSGWWNLFRSGLNDPHFLWDVLKKRDTRRASNLNLKRNKWILYRFQRGDPSLCSLKNGVFSKRSSANIGSWRLARRS